MTEGAPTGSDLTADRQELGGARFAQLVGRQIAHLIERAGHRLAGRRYGGFRIAIRF